MKRLIKHLLDPKTVLVLALSYTLTVLILSLAKMDKLPVPKFNQSDKFAHVFAYLGLALIWYAFYFSKKSWKAFYLKPLIVICLLSIAFGIFIEVLQGTLTSYRTIDAWDVLANSIGVSLAFLFILSIKKALEKIKTEL